MKIAAIRPEGPGALDRALTALADRLLAEGLRPVGAIKPPPDAAPADRCNAELRILPDGGLVRITQDLGPGSAACRLDAGALETAVAAAARALAQGGDLFILNKFGQQEADGRGFRPLIGEAVALGLPVVLGVPDAFRAAFDAFTGGAAETLPADPDRIAAWLRETAPA